MELSRRDVVVAAIVIFIAWGWVTHWIPTLRYLPYAFLAGCAITAAGTLYLILSTSRGRTRHVVKNHSRRQRNLAFVSPESWKAETASLKSRSDYQRTPLYPQSFVISNSIDGLLDLILRDFVASWYGKISGRPTFANEVDRAIRAVLVNIRDRVSKLDVVEVAISRVVPIITAHMSDFYEAERTVRGRKLTRVVTESEELDLAIAGKYRDGKLHPAASLTSLNTRLLEQQHLRSVVMRLLPKVLPDKMTASPSVSILIREIVACAVLLPVMQMLVDPDTWNQLLEAYGRTVLQVRRLRAALNEHAPSSPRPQKNISLPRIAPKDSDRQFERFIRAIKQCNSLSDARRFRSEVASQLRKESALKGQDLLYLRRLEAGRRLLDQKLTQLGAGGHGKPEPSIKSPPQYSRTTSHIEHASLRQVLYDASGLSYFMEYMDRLGLMRLVQFWIVVDGFRNPLEADTDDPQNSQSPSESYTASDRADIAQINEAYLTRPEIKITNEAKELVARFLKGGSKATLSQYQAARHAILQAQTSVYEEMQDLHFPNFKKSDLYYKWLASDETSIAPPSPTKSASNFSTGSKRSSLMRPPILPRTSTHGSNKGSSDLRRAIASSSDLRGFVRSSEVDTSTRRSLDESARRTPLFDDDHDIDPLASSTHSLETAAEPAQGDDNSNNEEIVDVMQAALNDIMVTEPDKDSLFSDTSVISPQESTFARGPFEKPRSVSPSTRRGKPSIASLGLVGTPSRRGVFSDDALFRDEENSIEAEYEDSDVNDKSDADEIHEAAPGDLGLAEAIDALTVDIEKLTSQESILESLTKKAELTNNAAELRILRKSRASLQRELHQKELQRQRYIVQEGDNSLYGRATVSIQSIMVGTEPDGNEYALYVIEVRRQAGEQMPAAAWVVARRYSEFHNLNKRLRTWYPAVRSLEFPKRQIVLKLQKDFLKKRRLALERYLQELLKIPAVCRSRELRAFLSQQAIVPTGPSNAQVDTRDFITRIYNSVTDGMEEFLGNIPVLDQLSLAGQNLISAATAQLNNAPPNTVPASADVIGVSKEPVSAAEAEAELRAFENRELEPFVKPICDLFLETFELNRETNWLRGRAVVVVLHQLLGSTIERKIRDTTKAHLQEDSVANYINMVKDKMWPNGKMRVAAPPRTAAEKAMSRREAGLFLATLVPELVGTVVGRGNAQAASRKILAMLNNQRLNTHLVYTLLDEIVQVVFGDNIGRH